MKYRRLTQIPSSQGQQLTTFLMQNGAVVQHSKIDGSTSALGQKRTLGWVRVMSALLPKADIEPRSRNVRFVPKADIDGYSITSLASEGADAADAGPPLSVASVG
jgi:hypothetical protein